MARKPTYETNLLSYLASSVKLLNYETLENAINLTFNNEIFSDFNNQNILEELKYLVYQEYATGMYTISLN